MSKEKVFSYTKGYAFIFEEKGHVIKAWFSAISGLERIYINDKVVSSRRGISKHSTHHFSIDGDEYSVDINVVSLLKGPFVCTLNKNGEACKRKKLVFSKLTFSSFLGYMLIFMAFGALFGVAGAHWQLPPIFSCMVLALLFFAIFAYDAKKTKMFKPFIEDEKI